MALQHSSISITTAAVRSAPLLSPANLSLKWVGSSLTCHGRTTVSRRGTILKTERTQDLRSTKHFRFKKVLEVKRRNICTTICIIRSGTILSRSSSRQVLSHLSSHLPSQLLPKAIGPSAISSQQSTTQQVAPQNRLHLTPPRSSRAILVTTS